jgi:hypothetical protein
MPTTVLGLEFKMRSERSQSNVAPLDDTSAFNKNHKPMNVYSYYSLTHMRWHDRDVRM